MIKVIVFDLGGVLFTNGTKRFIKYLHSTYALDTKVLDEVIGGELGGKYREGKIGRDEFWRGFLEKLNIHEDVDKLEDQWINGYELIEETRDIILKLSSKYKVYYLSNNARERVARINNKYNFREWFEDGIFSHEAGVRKPAPEIYRLIIEKAGVKPEEMVFIDDKLSCLQPAKEMGIKTILFENPKKLKNELTNLGVI